MPPFLVPAKPRQDLSTSLSIINAASVTAASLKLEHGNQSEPDAHARLPKSPKQLTPQRSRIARPPIHKKHISTLELSSALTNKLTIENLPRIAITHPSIGVYDGGLERDLKRSKNEPAIKQEDLLHLGLALSPTRPSSTRAWHLNMFEMGGPLGKGQYGRVYMVRTRREKFILALKVVSKSHLISKHSERNIRREIEIQKNLRHPHILRLYGFFHDETRIFLMLEFAGKGELYKQLYKAKGGFTEERSGRYMHQMTDALIYLHSKHVIHRDIKPENLLLTIDDQLKIADFGWSVHSPSDRRKTYCGTLDYIPCEMIEEKEYSSKVDNWALGVLMYEFLSGCAPFARTSDPDGESRNRTQMRVVNVDYTLPDHLSSEAKDLIRKLLQHNPKDRLELCGVLKHPWILRHNPPAPE